MLLPPPRHYPHTPLADEFHCKIQNYGFKTFLRETTEVLNKQQKGHDADYQR